MDKRTIVIGDLHGCYDEAIELLRKCNAMPEDRVIFLGDLIDRGPDNDKCVDLAMKHECILGNHEEKHIFYENEMKRKGRLPSMPPTHTAARMQLRPEHHEYFRSLPLMIKLPEYNAVCVHAGVYPGRSVDKQTPKHLLHIQSIDPYDKWGAPTGNEKSMWPSKAPEGWLFWTNFWKGPERIIFGHSVLDRPLVTEFVMGIDGGAVFGRDLHALVLPSWEIVTVSAKTDFGKGSRGRDNDAIMMYPVQDGVNTFS